MERTFARHLLLLPVFLFLLWAAVAGVQWVRHAPKSVTLPNGMMLKLQYYFPPRSGRAFFHGWQNDPCPQA